MADKQHLPTSQLPAASPLGRDDKPGDASPSTESGDIARKSEEKIEAAVKRKVDDSADSDAYLQRGSSTGYGKEEHMNEELAKQKERERVEGGPSVQPS